MRKKKEINITFAKKIKYYYRLIFRLTKKFFYNTEICMDLTQEIIIKVYYQLNDFANLSKIETWIYTITKNHCLNYKNRSYQKQELNDDLDNHLNLSSFFTTPESACIKNEELFMITQVINQLPLHLKTPIILYYYDNLRYSEIASILQIPSGTVKSRINTARYYIRQELMFYFS